MKNIPVKVSGRTYLTYIDKHKVQRFLSDPLIVGAHEAGLLDLNKMHVLFLQKKLGSKRRYMEFKMSLGYSVCGFADLFPYAKIENPLWEQGER